MKESARFDWPEVALIVAIRNEEALIAGKLDNLAALDYPTGKLQLIIVDGGSTDGTLALIESRATRTPAMCIIRTQLANKTAQINEALTHVRAPWVLVTDADARMPPDTLLHLIQETARDPCVAVVGTPVVPHRPHALDTVHWWLSNRVRLLEQRAGRTTGLVAAPCYLFRRTLVDRFPADTIADDVHVACRAAVEGGRVALVDKEVHELRVASSAAGWYRHKVRRTLGYLREVFRFLPAAQQMPLPMRAVFLWRAFTLTLVPPVALAVLLALALIAGPALAISAALLVALASVAGSPSARGGSVVTVLSACILPIWLIMITATAIVCYPFVRQNASYARGPAGVGESAVWS